MFLLDVQQHVLEHPERGVAVVVAPMAGGLVRIGGNLCRVHAAQWKATLALRSDLGPVYPIVTMSFQKVGRFTNTKYCS
jgi:hypothetical protein